MSRPSPYATTGEHCAGCGRAQVRLDTDGNGRLVEVATPCRCHYWRRIHCICQWCDEPVTGKPKVALYCDRHRKDSLRQAQERYRRSNPDAAAEACRRYYERNRDTVRAKARARYQFDAEARERKNAYKREWRRKNRDKVRMQKRRAALRSGGGASEWQHRYRAEVAAGIRQPKRAPRNSRGERLCLTPECGAVMRGRAKKCDPCRRGYLPREVEHAA